MVVPFAADTFEFRQHLPLRRPGRAGFFSQARLSEQNPHTLRSSAEKCLGRRYSLEQRLFA